jgi:hypothetical protein
VQFLAQVVTFDMIQNRKMVTAADLDLMSPNERAAAFAERVILNLDELPEGFRAQVLETGAVLAAKLDSAAA